MRCILIFSIVIVMVCSCGEPSPQKSVYTEKDIEGYWATSTAINGSELIQSIDNSSNQQAESSVLRLFNDELTKVSYAMSHDTLFLNQFDIKLVDWIMVPKYKILFISEDRLEVTEIKTGISVTYYSLLTLPATRDSCYAMRFLPLATGWYFNYSVDSTYWTYEDMDDGTIVCGTLHDATRVPDSEIVNRINLLYSRLSQDDILYAKQDTSLRLAYSLPLELNGTRGLEVLGSAGTSSNPVIRLLAMEFQALAERYNN